MERRFFVGLYKGLAIGAVALVLVGCGKTVQEHFEQARAALSQNDLNTAAIELKNVLQKNQSHAEARKMLGGVYLKFGDGAAAEKELRRARELGSDVSITDIAEALLLQRKYKDAVAELGVSQLQGVDDAKRQALLGDAHFNLGQGDKAEKAYKAALAQESAYVPAYLGLGRLEMGRRNFKVAADYIGKALEAAPENAETWLLKGDLAFIQKDHSAAQSAFEQALKFAGKSAVDRYRAQSSLANALLAQNKAAEAKKYIDALLKRDPNGPGPLYLKALAAYMQDDLQNAEDALLGVLKVAPNHKASIFLLGAVNFRQGHLEQAEMHLSNFVSAFPSHIPARKLLGATRLRLNQPEGAVEAVAEGLAESPDDLQLLSIMGTAAIRSGDVKEGLAFLEKAVKENPEVLPLRNQLAAAYIESGDSSKAIQELQAVSGDAEQQYQSNVLLVLGYLRQGQADKALDVAQELVSDYPDRSHPYVMVGSVFLTKGDTERAREQFLLALKKQPDFVPAMVSLARMEARLGNLKDAQTRFEQVLAVDKKHVDSMMALSQISERLGDRQQALNWLEEARKVSDAIGPRIVLVQYYLRENQLDKARELVREAEKANPKNGTILALKATVELESGASQEAVNILRKLVADQPKYAQGYLLLARAYQAQKNVSGARKALNQALKVKPDFVEALVSLVKLETEAGNRDQAKALIAQFKQKNPKAALGDVLEGDWLMADGNYTGALKAYNKASKVADNANVVLRRYRALAGQGKVKESIELLQGWLAKNNSDQVRFALAQGYQDSGRRKEAIGEYERLLKDHQNSPPLLNNLAWLYMEEGDARASELADRAYKSAPDNGAIADTAGWVYARQGHWQKALKPLEIAAEAMPDQPEVRYHYAAALAKNGRTDEALKHLEASLASAQDFTGRKDAEALLKELH